MFYIFGSYAIGKAGALSDLDLAYWSEGEISPRFLGALENLFGEEAIDLVNLRRAPPGLIHRVLRGKCLYAKNLKIKIGFEMKAEARYWDMAYLRKVYFEHLLRRIE